MSIEQEKEIELLKEKNIDLRLRSLEDTQRLRENLLDARLKAVEQSLRQLNKWLIGILITAVGELLLIVLALVIPQLHMLIGK